MVGGLQLGAALVVLRLAVVTLPPSSTVPAVAGCRLDDSSVIRGWPLMAMRQGCHSVSSSSRGPILPPVPCALLQLQLQLDGGWVGFPIALFCFCKNK